MIKQDNIIGEDLIYENGKYIEGNPKAREQLQPPAQAPPSTFFHCLIFRNAGKSLLLPDKCFREPGHILAITAGPSLPQETSWALLGLNEACAYSPPKIMMQYVCDKHDIPPSAAHCFSFLPGLRVKEGGQKYV